MTINKPMTASERQLWYWMKECEYAHKKMKDAQEANAPDMEEWERRYTSAKETLKELERR